MAERVASTDKAPVFPGPSRENDVSPANAVANSAANSAAQSEVIQHLYQELLGKTSQYLKSEFEVTAEDYRLIQQMNKVTKDKYEDLLGTAKAVKDSLATTNDRFTCIKPFLDRIDSVEAQVNEMERTVFRLDTYAKQLEIRFKSLEKR